MGRLCLHRGGGGCDCSIPMLTMEAVGFGGIIQGERFRDGGQGGRNRRYQDDH